MDPLLAAMVRAGLLSQDEAERINRQFDDNLAREFAEQTLLNQTRAGMGAQQDRLIDLMRNTNGNASRQQLTQFWDGEDERLYRQLEPTISDIASEQAVRTAVQAGSLDTWQLVNEQMLDWAQNYYANPDITAVGSIPNLNLTSRRQVLDAVTNWQRGELQSAGVADGLPQLIRSLEPTFGAERAERIAVTEYTRIDAEATRSAANSNPDITSLRLLTAADEIVCPICGPLHGMLIRKSQSGFTHPTLGNVGFPPLHVRCRCAIIEETSATANLPLPPEDQYVFEGSLPEAT